MARASRYRIEDDGEPRRYTPAAAYYAGLAFALVPLVVSLVHHLEGREVELQPIVLGGRK